MIDSPYVAQVELGLNLLVRSIRVHHQAVLRRGFLGEKTTESEFRSSLFEIGCLHLFIVDQALRASYPDDAFLGEVSMLYGNWLLSTFPESHNNPAYGDLLSNRLRGYAESIALSASDNWNDRTVLDDVLFAFSGQLLWSFQADKKADGGIFLGSVETSDFEAAVPEETRRFLLRGIKENLYEHLLPIRQIAVLWSDETPFYQKAIDDLNTRVREGEQQALDVWRSQCESRREIFAVAWWAARHDGETPFRLLAWPGDAPSTWEEGAIIKEYDPNRFPHLRVVPDPEGIPLRKLLLLAHSLRAGLVAQENNGDNEREPLEVRLSLGGVDALLRGGSAGLVAPERSPDFSEPGNLRVVPTDFYYLPTPARLSLFRLYLDTRQKIQLDAQNTLPSQPWDPIVDRLFPHVEQELEAVETSDEYDAGIRASWVSDASGTGALAIGPVADAEVLRYVRWLVAPGTVVLAEATPELAQYPLGYSKEGNVSGTREGMDKPSDAAKSIVRNPLARFVRTEEMIFGPVSGEPYDVLRQTDDPVLGKPLLEYALSAYDGGRGLALRDEDNRLAWWNSFGEVITFLWERELEADAPEPADEPVKEAQPSGRKRGRIGAALLPPPAQPAVAPDMITLPDLSRANIAWILVRRGVPNPYMGMVKQSGETKLYFGPTPPLSDDNDIVRWRIGWYLPRGARNFEFQYAPVLIPAPMPYTAP